MNIANLDDAALQKWMNSMRNTDEGMRYSVRKLAQQYKQAGYSSTVAEELLLSKDYPDDVIKHVVSSVYDTSPITQTETLVPVIPTSYSELQPYIEHMLNKLGSSEFIAKLCLAENPIVKKDKAGRTKLANLAHHAMTDKIAMQDLHTQLKPWFEEIILQGVLAAEHMKDVKVVQSTADTHRYQIKTASNKHVVDFKQCTSTGERFAKGNFADFGLPDEYMIVVAKQYNPVYNIKKKIQQ